MNRLPYNQFETIKERYEKAEVIISEIKQLELLLERLNNHPNIKIFDADHVKIIDVQLNSLPIQEFHHEAFDFVMAIMVNIKKRIATLSSQIDKIFKEPKP